MLKRYKNGDPCPYCVHGVLEQQGLAQMCNRCRCITMKANNAVLFGDLAEGEEFVFEYHPDKVFIKRKPEGAPESIDISILPAHIQKHAMYHNRVVMHIKGEPKHYGFCSPLARVVRADQRLVYGWFSWN